MTKERRCLKKRTRYAHLAETTLSGACFSKVPKRFCTRKAIAKSQTLWLQSCFIHTFLIWTQVPFIQEVSGVFTSQFLDKDELKMVLQAQNVSGAFEKQAPGLTSVLWINISVNWSHTQKWDFCYVWKKWCSTQNSRDFHSCLKWRGRGLKTWTTIWSYLCHSCPVQFILVITTTSQLWK